jgi:O-antigen ligase
MDFFTILIALIALLWLTAFMLRASLVAGCLVMLIGGTLFGYSFWSAGNVPLTIDRLLAVLLAVMYGFHRLLRWTDPKPLMRADWLLFAFIAVLAVSTFTHDWHFQQTKPLFKLIQYFAIPAMAYWAIRQSPLDEHKTRWMFGVVALFGVYVSLTAVAELLGWHWALFPTHLASPKLEFFGRARGPLLNPAGNGILITLCLAAGLTFWQRTTRGGQLALLAFTSLSLAALYATLTRSAWIGGALGLGIFICLSAPAAWRNLLIAAGAAGVLVLSVAKWDQIWNLKRDADLEASASADSAELRPLLAKVAWNMFSDHPLAGSGFGQYDREKLPYLADRTEAMPLEKTKPYIQHNAFLALLAETGLLGAGLFIAVLASWTLTAWRLARNQAAPLWTRQVGIVFLALLGAYLANSNFHDTNMIDMLNVWLFTIGGLVIGTAAVCHRNQLAASTSAASGNQDTADHADETDLRGSDLTANLR